MANDEHPASESQPTNRKPTATIALVVIVVLVIVALSLFLFGRDDDPEPTPEPAPVQQPEPRPAPEPEPEPEPQPAPAPEPEPEPEPEPLPELDQSDEPALNELEEATDSEQVKRLLVSDELIRKVVRAGAAASDGKVVHEYRPVVSPTPPLKVAKVGEARTDAEQEYRLLEENFRRYDPYVNLLTDSDTDQLVNWYQRYRPLLEEAFNEHGVNNGPFHQVVLETIDELLATPEPPEDIRLHRPKVFYEYRNPELEQLTDLQKLMIRMGPEHHAAVKQALRALKTELEALPDTE